MSHLGMLVVCAPSEGHIGPRSRSIMSAGADSPFGPHMSSCATDLGLKNVVFAFTKRIEHSARLRELPGPMAGRSTSKAPTFTG